MNTNSDLVILGESSDQRRGKRRKLSHSIDSPTKSAKSPQVSVVHLFLQIVPILVDNIRESLECDELDLELSRFSRWSATVRHPLPYMVATSIGFFEGLGRTEVVPTLVVDRELSNDEAGGKMLGALLKDRADECPLLGEQLRCAFDEATM